MTILVHTGLHLTSVRGRALSPVPKVAGTTSRKAYNTIKRLDTWLVEEAIKEATENPMAINEDLIRGLNPNKLSVADRALLNHVLFDNPDGPSQEAETR